MVSSLIPQLNVVILYVGMDWWIPGFNEALAKQLAIYHGNITAENTIHNIVSIVQTGSLQVAVYDLPNELLYVANARGEGETGPIDAYDRYVHVLLQPCIK